MNPTQQAQLRKALADADPETSPLLARQIQALAAYQQAKQQQPPPPPPRASNAAPGSSNRQRPPDGSRPLSNDPQDAESENPLRGDGHSSAGTKPSTGTLRETPGADDASGPKLAKPRPASAPAASPIAPPSVGEDIKPQAAVAAIADADNGAKQRQTIPVRDPAVRPATAQSVTVGPPPPTVPAERNDRWKQDLQRTIQALKDKPDDPSTDAFGQLRRAAYLRLLYLVSGDTDRAVQPIEGADPPEQEFWKHQLHGLAVYLDRSGMPVRDRRVALALRRLRDAESHLAETSALDVKALAFCSAVHSYGVYTEFSNNEFEPDQEVLLYVEIDNFSSKRTPEGYVTSLQGSYQVFDAAGRRVADQTFPVEQETCRNRRRDYFIPYRMWMPKKIYPGNYVLQLTVEDTQARKFGQSSIPFKIKP